MSVEGVLKVKLVTEDATCPRIATKSSAGYDLFAQADGKIEAGRRSKIDLGIIMEIPEGYYGQICSRSSLSLKNGIMSMGGVVDADYRGELCVILFNSGENDFIYSKGDRIAQIVIIKIFTDSPVEVEATTETKRSTGGFGSTGH